VDSQPAHRLNDTRSGHYGRLVLVARPRQLAAYYRTFALQAEDLTISEARLRTAQDLEADADRIERRAQDGSA
jgi:hypothetical protein